MPLRERPHAHAAGSDDGDEDDNAEDKKALNDLKQKHPTAWPDLKLLTEIAELGSDF